jgi:hypothetical protein
MPLPTWSIMRRRIMDEDEDDEYPEDY